MCDLVSASSRLPTELLLEILAHLSGDQKTLYSCVLASSRWNHIVTPLLWKRPCFYRLDKVELFATTLINTKGRVGRYAGLVESLSFSTLAESDRNNPHLATLVDTIINCMAQLSNQGMGTGGARWTPNVIKRSRSLSRNSQASEGDVGLIDDSVLQLSADSQMSGMRLFDSENTCAVYKSSLKKLDLRFCKGVRNYSMQRLAPKLASLVVLDLAGGLRTDITIAKLAQHMCGLKRLSLAWTSNLTDFGVSEIVQRCRDIEALDLTYCTQIEDTSMFAIAHHLESLTALSVAYCAGVTDIGVREVTSRCTSLKILNVAKCLRVSDRSRKNMEKAGITSKCDSFEPFSIHFDPNTGPLNKR
ncbi:hypothetical protein H4R99_004133 [Coemansia sp. RSA 1722]|nr:hypothetical protein H4R99_004133 [Coemansia sp. RSA 1722]